MAPYSDDVQSPDWLRDYPSNGGEALAYQKVGHLWDVAAKAGVSFKNYGEYIEYNSFLCQGRPALASLYRRRVCAQSPVKRGKYFSSVLGRNSADTERKPVWMCAPEECGLHPQGASAGKPGDGIFGPGENRQQHRQCTFRITILVASAGKDRSPGVEHDRKPVGFSRAIDDLQFLHAG